MTKKKPPGLNNAQRALYKVLIPPAKHGVLNRPPNRDGYGLPNRMEITWKPSFPIPQGFPRGNIASEDEEGRTMWYTCDVVLDWAFKVGLTRDTPAAIYKSRAGALISLAKLENSIFNFDERIFQELLDGVENKPQNSCVGQDNETSQGETE